VADPDDFQWFMEEWTHIDQMGCEIIDELIVHPNAHCPHCGNSINPDTGKCRTHSP
jgi:hypothetical protein